MRITHLSLQNFRNYTRLELAMPDQPVVLVGRNAQGKTSLLEAIYYLATASSPYTSSDRQLMNWRMENEYTPFTRVSAEVTTRKGINTRIDITLLKEPLATGGERFRKEVRINSITRRNLDLQGQLAVVMFLPQDLSLVEGSPSNRRRYLDLTLGQIDQAYTEALSQFDKTLSQRNALLRRIGDHQAKPTELTFWDDQLAELAAVLIAGRQRFIRELEVFAGDIHRELSGNQEDLELVYQPGFEPTATEEGQQSFNLFGLDFHRQLEPEQIIPQFKEALLDKRRDEIRRGMTLIGPQRDDMRFMVNRRDLSLYGSRGQARTAIMALKIAEMEWMQRTLQESPVLLLDEVVAELDAERREFLLSRVAHARQVLLTTTEPGVLTGEFLDNAAVWKIEMGQINQNR